MVGQQRWLSVVLTCIAEHLVLHDDLVAVESLGVHLIVCVLVGKVE